MKETIEFIQLLDRVEKATRRLPDKAATLAVNFSKSRFREKNWVGTGITLWPKNKPGWNKKPRKSTGKLKRNIRKARVTNNKEMIFTDLPYAHTQNNGFKGMVKQKVRMHERRTRNGKATVKAYGRTLNQNIPARQFIGESAVLDTEITGMMTAEITKSFK
jgi:phage gpG-like protein